MTERAWRLGQAVVVVGTVLLLAGLLVRPALSLDLLWNLAVPVLPAVFLLSPALWRNVCPLATLSDLPWWGGERSLSPAWSRWAAVGGIVLLALLVPARRVFFNEHALAAFALVAGVAVLALTLGFLFDRKAGFCNAVCPVLPVERLYGQKPFLELANAHCPSCTLCTARACLDLAGERGALVALGAGSRRGRKWMGTPYGAFAAAFPGFVVGYYMTEDVGLSAAAAVYGEILAWAAVSFVLVAGVTWALRIRAAVALPTLGAVAVGLYYWFVAPLVGAAWGLGGGGVAAIRIAALGLVLVWAGRALRPVLAAGSPAGVGPTADASD